MRISRPRWPLFVATIAVSVFAVWIISPRFAIEGPSVVDDWSAITHSGEQLESLARFENPERERFRPGWIAWNYVQWHTLGAPAGLVGPNVWNVWRVLVFVVGMTLMTALLLPRADGRLRSTVSAGLAVLPAFTAFVVPKVARDFARFGPQEPLLVGSLALGGSLLFLAGRTLVSESPVRRLRFAAYVLGGGFFWLVGMYQKETSLAAIPLVAAVLYCSRHDLRRLTRLNASRRRWLVALGVGSALPLLHVAAQTVLITARGDLVYGGQLDRGQGIVSGVQSLWASATEEITPNARTLIGLSFGLVVVTLLVRRRVDALALGTLASAALAAVFAAQSGFAVSRYYIPILALCVVATSLSLAYLPTVVAASGALLVFFAFMPPRETQAEVKSWRDAEQTQVEIVELVATLERSGCRIAVEGLDLETQLALPVLTARASPDTRRACAEGYLLLPPTLDAELETPRACMREELEPLIIGRLVALHECRRVRADEDAALEAHRFASKSS